MKNSIMCNAMNFNARMLLNGVIILVLTTGRVVCQDEVPEAFFVKKSEISLSYTHAPGARELSFYQWNGSPQKWRKEVKGKLTELIRLIPAGQPVVTEVRKMEHQGVTIHALVMEIDNHLSIPAYLLVPPEDSEQQVPVMAIHGHGEVEQCIGLRDDYHHFFALELAKAGHLVLCPELRGFGTLEDLAFQREIDRLDYWNWGGHMQYSLVSDNYLYGSTLVGQTVGDLLLWEEWLAVTHGVDQLHVAGISYGGDLACLYPIFSERVERIFASGTLCSLSVIYRRCYNAPAHCIPGILQWMDRSDIAGINAPRPIVFHYGELD
ncbi:MAG: hypothetical protein KAT15_03805, partial [Bacteroidales bacterium]|nr:hypothetical protein [Bacteroidales bacterium]